MDQEYDKRIGAEDLTTKDYIANRLAREEYQENRGPFEAHLKKFDTPGQDWEGEEESELDRIARGNRFEKMSKERASRFQESMPEEESMWDKFTGLFSSDDDDKLVTQDKEAEAKANEELSGKIGAAAKLYSLLQPETPQAAPQIPAAKISRGSVAFPGMKLASQKARRKYYTPKGLMA